MSPVMNIKIVVFVVEITFIHKLLVIQISILCA